MANLIKNAIKIWDGMILQSRHGWDYVDYVDSKGNFFTVDGGYNYLRRSGDPSLYVDISVWDDAPFEVVRESFEWGSYGKDGKEPLHYIKLKDMTEEHIQNIFKTQSNLKDHIRTLMEKELEFRSKGE